MKNNKLVFILLIATKITLGQGITPYISVGHTTAVNQLKLVNKNKYLISVDNAGKCIIWDLFNKRELNYMTINNKASIEIIDDSTLNVSTEEFNRSLPNFQKKILKNFIKKNIEKQIQAEIVSGDKKIKVFKEGKLEIVIPKSLYDFKGVSINADDSYLAHVCEDNYVTIRSTKSLVLFERIDLKEPLTQIAFHPLIPELAIVGCKSGRIKLLNILTKKELFTLRSNFIRPNRIYEEEKSKNIIINTDNYSYTFNLEKLEEHQFNAPIANNTVINNYLHIYNDSTKKSEFYYWYNYKLFHSHEDLSGSDKIDIQESSFLKNKIIDKFLTPLGFIMSKLLLFSNFLDSLSDINTWKLTAGQNVNFKNDNDGTVYYNVNKHIYSTDSIVNSFNIKGTGDIKYAFNSDNILSFRSPFYLTLFNIKSKNSSLYFMSGINDLFTINNNLFVLQIKEKCILIISTNDSLHRSLEINGQYINSNSSHSEFYIENNQYIIAYNSNTLDEIYRISKEKEDKPIFVKPFFTRNGTKKYIIFYTLGFASIVDLKNETSATFFFYDNGEFLISQPDSKFYVSTKSLLEEVIVKDIFGRVFQLDQFETIYNRPDIVMQRLNILDSTTVKRYTIAYNASLNKIDHKVLPRYQSNLSAPKAEIADWYNNLITSDSIAKIKIKYSGFPDTLININLYINNIPIFGEKGYSLIGRNRKCFDTTLCVKLCKGDNYIKPTCISKTGFKNYVSAYYINADYYSPGRVYFLGIGIDSYYVKGHDLPYCKRDIKMLDSCFCRIYKKKLRSHTLLDSEVSRKNILEKINSFSNIRENDMLIVAFSGHGWIYDNKYYLSIYTSNMASPSTDGFLFSEVEHLVDLIPARKKIILIDACHSGPTDSDNYANFQKYNSAFYALQDSFSYYSQGTGTVIISATKADQKATGRQLWRGGSGALTSSILDGFANKAADLNKDGVLTVSELKIYASRRVIEKTKGKQSPTARHDLLDFDWFF